MGSSAKLVENVVAKEGQRTGNHAVECFHHAEQPVLVRDPWLGGTGWNCYSDSQPFFKHKPGSESALQCSAAVIDERKVALCQARRQGASLAPAQRLIRPLVKHLSQHLDRKSVV